MAPLIDVVFLLLIFFMLTFAIQSQGIEINLPKDQASELQDEEILTVRIDENQAIRINNKIILLENLKDLLKTHLNKRSDKSVVVEAHKNTPYNLFTKVLDISRLAGAEGFSIVK